MYLFVYGTLRSCYSDINKEFLGNARYMGLGFIRGFDMYLISYYPGIISGSGIVIGEVYEISKYDIAKIDEYEGYNGKDDDLYTRIKTSVFFGKNKIELGNVYVYRYNGRVDYSKKVHDGDFCSGKAVPVYFQAKNGLKMLRIIPPSPVTHEMVKATDEKGNIYFAFVED